MNDEQPDEWPKGCNWPDGKKFTFANESGSHDPCYVVMPDGACITLNHYADAETDITRAHFIIAACNYYLHEQTPKRESVEEKCPDCGAIMLEVCSGLEDMTTLARTCRAESGDLEDMKIERDAWKAEHSKVLDDVAKYMQHNGWQPIATAPKDGTDILMWDHDFEGIVMGYWDDDKNGWENFYTEEKHEFITHWMPILKSPTDIEGDKS